MMDENMGGRDEVKPLNFAKRKRYESKGTMTGECMSKSEKFRWLSMQIAELIREQDELVDDVLDVKERVDHRKKQTNFDWTFRQILTLIELQTRQEACLRGNDQVRHSREEFDWISRQVVRLIARYDKLKDVFIDKEQRAVHSRPVLPDFRELPLEQIKDSLGELEGSRITGLIGTDIGLGVDSREAWLAVVDVVQRLRDKISFVEARYNECMDEQIIKLGVALATEKQKNTRLEKMVFDNKVCIRNHEWTTAALERQALSLKNDLADCQAKVAAARTSGKGDRGKQRGRSESTVDIVSRPATLEQLNQAEDVQSQWMQSLASRVERTELSFLRDKLQSVNKFSISLMPRLIEALQLQSPNIAQLGSGQPQNGDWATALVGSVPPGISDNFPRLLDNDGTPQPVSSQAYSLFGNSVYRSDVPHDTNDGEVMRIAGTMGDIINNVVTTEVGSVADDQTDESEIAKVGKEKDDNEDEGEIAGVERETLTSNTESSSVTVTGTVEELGGDRVIDILQVIDDTEVRRVIQDPKIVGVDRQVLAGPIETRNLTEVSNGQDSASDNKDDQSQTPTGSDTPQSIGDHSSVINTLPIDGSPPIYVTQPNQIASSSFVNQPLPLSPPASPFIGRSARVTAIFRPAQATGSEGSLEPISMDKSSAVDTDHVLLQSTPFIHPAEVDISETSIHIVPPIGTAPSGVELLQDDSVVHSTDAAASGAAIAFSDAAQFDGQPKNDYPNDQDQTLANRVPVDTTIPHGELFEDVSVKDSAKAGVPEVPTFSTDNTTYNDRLSKDTDVPHSEEAATSESAIVALDCASGTKQSPTNSSQNSDLHLGIYAEISPADVTGQDVFVSAEAEHHSSDDHDKCKFQNALSGQSPTWLSNNLDTLTSILKMSWIGALSIGFLVLSYLTWNSRSSNTLPVIANQCPAYTAIWSPSPRWFSNTDFEMSSLWYRVLLGGILAGASLASLFLARNCPASITAWSQSLAWILSGRFEMPSIFDKSCSGFFTVRQFPVTNWWRSFTWIATFKSEIKCLKASIARHFPVTNWWQHSAWAAPLNFDSGPLRAFFQRHCLKFIMTWWHSSIWEAPLNFASGWLRALSKYCPKFVTAWWQSFSMWFLYRFVRVPYFAARQGPIAVIFYIIMRALLAVVFVVRGIFTSIIWAAKRVLTVITWTILKVLTIITWNFKRTSTSIMWASRRIPRSLLHFQTAQFCLLAIGMWLTYRISQVHQKWYTANTSVMRESITSWREDHWDWQYLQYLRWYIQMAIERSGTNKEYILLI